MGRRKKRRLRAETASQPSVAGTVDTADTDAVDFDSVDDAKAIKTVVPAPVGTPSPASVREGQLRQVKAKGNAAIEDKGVKDNGGKGDGFKDDAGKDDAAKSGVEENAPLRHDVHTVGELLQQAREARGLSLHETSARTRIALKMLRYLESDRFDEFPADAYVKGFLRSYGSFLGLEVGMLIRRYEAFSGRLQAPAPEIWEEDEPRRRRFRPKLPISGRVLLVVGVVVAALALVWVFWSRGATRLGLRPTGGLESIENDLQETQVREMPAPSADRIPPPTVDEPASSDSGATLPEDTSPPVIEPGAPKPLPADLVGPPQASPTPAPATPAPKPKKPSKPPKKAPRTSPEDAAGPP